MFWNRKESYGGESISDEISDLRQRVMVLECDHEETCYEPILALTTTGFFREVCVKCGKIVKRMPEDEMLNDKLEKAETEVKALRDAISATA